LPPLPAADLEEVLRRTAPLWPLAKGARLLVTGGSGFIGRWLLESLLAANDEWALGSAVTVLTRDPGAFRRAAPHITEHPAVRLAAGDVRRFEISGASLSHVIHAAFDSSRPPGADETRDVIARGTENVLRIAKASGASRFLLLSSGAIYGVQPPEVTHLPESFAGVPKDPYGEAKRMAEQLARDASKEGKLEAVIARVFALVGPLLPLDVHFAIGNFIGDALARRPIQVMGDGSPFRSYLYASDLAIWLLTKLFRGRPSAAYNVGSEEAVSIATLARTVAGVLAPSLPVEIARTPAPGPPARYVPSTRLAREELGLSVAVGLEEAIARTGRWYSGLTARP
jgi:dTDP-glucose 4,6-dehydratase